MFRVIELLYHAPVIIGFNGLAPLMLEHSKQLTLNHGNTMDAMSQLGMGWCEILAVLEDRSFYAGDDERHAKAKVLAMMQAYKREQQSANEQLG